MKDDLVLIIGILILLRLKNPCAIAYFYFVTALRVPVNQVPFSNIKMCLYKILIAIVIFPADADKAAGIFRCLLIIPLTSNSALYDAIAASFSFLFIIPLFRTKM